MEQSVYCAENHTAKQTTNQKNRPFDFQQNKQQTKRTVPLISSKANNKPKEPSL